MHAQLSSYVNLIYFTSRIQTEVKMHHLTNLHVIVQQDKIIKIQLTAYITLKIALELG